MFLENFMVITQVYGYYTKLGFELFVYRYLLCTNMEKTQPPTDQRRENPEPFSDSLNVN